MVWNAYWSSSYSDGRDDDFSDLPEPRAAGSCSGQDYENHAYRFQHHVFLFPRWPRFVLVGKQRPVDRAAMADYARDGERQAGAWQMTL